MAGDAPLLGLSILVLEDEYYLADDMRRVLLGAGARVIGPFRDPVAAMAQVERRAPDCAVIDVNLGEGIDFGPARSLFARGVPIVIVTGYDAEVIPKDLANPPCLQKPVRDQNVVRAVMDVCRR